MGPCGVGGKRAFGMGGTGAARAQALVGGSWVPVAQGGRSAGRRSPAVSSARPPRQRPPFPSWTPSLFEISYNFVRILLIQNGRVLYF